MSEKFSICQIQLKSIKNPCSGELSDKVFHKCCFCGKNCEIYDNKNYLMNKLLGFDGFYCLFCLRHGFNSCNEDILILSFKSIINYFYTHNYLNSKKIWISEIEDYIEIHQKVGMLNPLFLYNPELMFWFIDFSKVGDEEKQIPLEEILKTIINILASFNLYETVDNMCMSKFYKKFKIAIESFYLKRYTPKNSHVVIPTLVELGIVESKIRNFVFSDLKR